MSKSSNQLKAQKLTEGKRCGFLDCCGEIFKETNETIRHTITKCEEIITEPGVSEKLKIKAYKTISREQTHRTVMVLGSMTIIAIVAAYAVKKVTDYYTAQDSIKEMA